MTDVEKTSPAYRENEARRARKQFGNQLSTLAGGVALLSIAVVWPQNLPFGMRLVWVGIIVVAEQGTQRRHDLRDDTVWGAARSSR